MQRPVTRAFSIFALCVFLMSCATPKMEANKTAPTSPGMETVACFEEMGDFLFNEADGQNSNEAILSSMPSCETSRQADNVERQATLGELRYYRDHITKYKADDRNVMHDIWRSDRGFAAGRLYDGRPWLAWGGYHMVGDPSYMNEISQDVHYRAKLDMEITRLLGMRGFPNSDSQKNYYNAIFAMGLARSENVAYLQNIGYEQLLKDGAFHDDALPSVWYIAHHADIFPDFQLRAHKLFKSLAADGKFPEMFADAIEQRLSNMGLLEKSEF